MNPAEHSPDRPRTTAPPADRRPVVAVTMGDGAGVGPEVVMAALAHQDTARRCRPLVIGDARRLRQAAGIVGSDDVVVSVTDPERAEWTPGRVNVVDLDLLPDDLPWGRLSAAAGEAAYRYVEEAARLAVRADVDAICTAPSTRRRCASPGTPTPDTPNSSPG